MENYEELSDSRVEELARQGDIEAFYDMSFRFDLLPINDRNNPIERCAWQDFWMEKAADAGHIDAKYRYANSLVNRTINAEDREMAFNYFQSLSDDYDAGKLSSKNDKENGIIAKLRLGIMLCEGYYTQRDATKGAALINTAKKLTNGFDGFGYETMSKLGALYATGLAQPDENPSTPDIEQAIQYFEIAVKRFNPEKNNPAKLKVTHDFLALEKTHLAKRGKEENSFEGFPNDLKIAFQKEKDDYNRKVADERRKKELELSDTSRMRMEADKAALARLRKRLALEGW